MLPIPARYVPCMYWSLQYRSVRNCTVHARRPIYRLYIHSQLSAKERSLTSVLVLLGAGPWPLIIVCVNRN